MLQSLTEMLLYLQNICSGFSDLSGQQMEQDSGGKERIWLTEIWFQREILV